MVPVAIRYQNSVEINASAHASGREIISIFGYQLVFMGGISLKWTDLGWSLCILDFPHNGTTRPT